MVSIFVLVNKVVDLIGMKSSATYDRSDGQIVYQNKYWTELTVVPISSNASRMRSADVVVHFLKL
jgi:hypothetical protein